MDSITAGLTAAFSDPIMILVPVLITAALVLVNGVFVAAEFAIIGVLGISMRSLPIESSPIICIGGNPFQHILILYPSIKSRTTEF